MFCAFKVKFPDSLMPGLAVRAHIVLRPQLVYAILTVSVMHLVSKYGHYERAVTGGLCVKLMADREGQKSQDSCLCHHPGEGSRHLLHQPRLSPTCLSAHPISLSAALCNNFILFRKPAPKMPNRTCFRILEAFGEAECKMRYLSSSGGFTPP